VDLQLLADELAIRNLAASYTDALNRGAIEEATATYADESALYMLDRPVVAGRQNITEWLRRTTDRYQWVVQLVHSGVVRIDGDTAHARWQVSETQIINDGSRRLIIGRYEDTVRRFPEGWRFVQRKFTARYMGPFDMSAEPLPDVPSAFSL
jgi:ketosteroid isomerase-like protein